ncbi:MAG: hypothetical protein JSV34_03545 [Candidatus Omnitrophota bacterium]|nr:MAG: hypothetical protein JSV34_03545 [Candidatus Omnitrophota bacterium]
MKDKEQEILVCQRALPIKSGAFTIVELLVVTLILGIIVSAIVAVLNMGYFSHPIGVTKVTVAHQARNVMNWIVKDTRQTSSSQIDMDNATVDYIKFKLCIGHNGTDLLWSSNFIEYTYNASADTLTRSDSGTGQSWQFYDIIASPFNVSQVLTDNILGVTVAVQKTARGSIKAGVNLTTEIKLRNE